MHLAILMTNTDESEFAHAHPKDGEKFTDLVQALRPEWTTEVFAVKDGVFPQDISEFDGVMITGSPASVRDDAPWVAQLFDVIREIDTNAVPLFGACFGHQAIALALGGAVGRNPDGWVHGVAQVTSCAPLPWTQAPAQMALYASHIEQVTQAPAGFDVVSRGPGCRVAGFVKGSRIFTTQYHPEMSHGFICDLVEHTADYVGAEVTAQAHASLVQQADQDVFAAQLVAFFEYAVQQ